MYTIWDAEEGGARGACVVATRVSEAFLGIPEGVLEFFSCCKIPFGENIILIYHYKQPSGYSLLIPYKRCYIYYF